MHVSDTSRVTRLHYLPRIVVASALGIAKRFKQRNRFENLLGDYVAGRLVDCGQVLQQQFRVFSFARSAFAPTNEPYINLGHTICHLCLASLT